MISVRLFIRFFVGILLVAPVSSMAESARFTSKNIDGDDVVVDSQQKLIWQKNSADVNKDGSISKDRYPDGAR